MSCTPLSCQQIAGTMEDEEFGEDVLVTTRGDGLSIKEEIKTKESRAEWEVSKVSAIKAEKKDEVEDEDEELYGGVSIKLNATASSQAEAEIAALAAAMTDTETCKTNDDAPVDSDDDDEDVAIVLNTDQSSSKPTLRFTGGGNRYVRGSHAGSQHNGPGTSNVSAMVGSQPEDLDKPEADGMDDMAIFGGRRTAFDVDIDLLEDRPWRKPGIDISDYFNYGFDEHTWREYATRQLRLRRELAVEKSREQASRQAVNAANQQIVRDRDAKVQGQDGKGVPLRGLPGHASTEGDNEIGEWGGHVVPLMGNLPPRGGNFMGGLPPRGWHPSMGPPPAFMGQQDWTGPPMGGAPWGPGPGRGPPWMAGPNAGRGNGHGSFDERGRTDDRDNRRGGQASRDRSRSRDRPRRDDSRSSGRRDGLGLKDTNDKDRGREKDRDGRRESDRERVRDSIRDHDRDRGRPREREGRGSGDQERDRTSRNRLVRSGRSRSRDRDSRKRKTREESAGGSRSSDLRHKRRQ